MANVPIVTDVTKIQLDALIASASLEEGLQYNITDRGIRLTAVSSTEFDPNGLRKMLCPANYKIGVDTYGNNWIGVWNTNRTPSINDLTIWGGLVWKNLTGDVGAYVDDYGLDLINWVVIPKASFTNHEYISLIFNVNYDVENDWINKQWDKKGNIFGVDKTTFESYGYLVNLCDLSDWNMDDSELPFSNNNCMGVWNNSNTGGIYENHLQGGYISLNSNVGDIAWNILLDRIELNSNNGGITVNVVTGIFENSNNGEIYGNRCKESINSNSNNGRISDNINLGYINNNSSLPATQCNIFRNNNNGNITGIWDNDVTEVLVTKTGTAS
jgi:hypothetical protein